MTEHKIDQKIIDNVMELIKGPHQEIIRKALTEYYWYEGEPETAVYELNMSFGRMGDLEGVFTAKKKDVEKLKELDLTVYFGEVLGKHSEIYGSVKDSITMLSDDPKQVANCRESGFNPFDYTTIDSEAYDDLTVQEIINLENAI